MRSLARPPGCLAGLIAALALAGCGSSNKTGAGASLAAPIAGIPCQAEALQVHYHAGLTLIRNGKEVPLPAAIGINGQASCLYWLHTHNTDGIIHVESPRARTFTLGEFFQVWGEPLSRERAADLAAQSGEQLHIFVDGKPFSGDPKTIELKPHEVITIESGRRVPAPQFKFPAGL
jgi:hypothetical protein